MEGPFTGFPARADQRTYVLHVDILALVTTYSDRCRKQRQALTGGSTAVMQIWQNTVTYPSRRFNLYHSTRYEFYTLNSV